MSPQLLRAAGDITIGGADLNISLTTPFTPASYHSNATISEFTVIGALASDPSVLVSNTTDPAGGKITVINPVGWSNANDLTLDSNKGITVSAAMSNDGGGDLGLIANNGGIELNGIVEITGSSGLLARATSGITQDNLHVLTINGQATFDSGDSDIILTSPTNNFGSLDLSGGNIAIHEASDSILAGVDVGSLGLVSQGSISQTGAVQVDGLAKFNSGTNSIILKDSENEFGRLDLTGGAVTIKESSGTDLSKVVVSVLSIDSGGGIMNSGDVSVAGSAEFKGASINLGTAGGAVAVGNLNFNSTGNVTLSMASATTITGANSAAHFIWNTGAAATIVNSATIIANSVDIQKGSIALSGSNQIIAGSLTVNDGTSFDLGGFNDKVGIYHQNGTAVLSGSGILTADIYNLNGGSVNATIGTGILNQVGNTTTLNGESGAAEVNITGGTLEFGGSNRLADIAIVKLGPGTLLIGEFSDTVKTFTLDSGMLDGSGTLTADDYNLNGGRVNANLGAGTLHQTGNLSVLSGISDASAVNVTGGTLALAAPERLTNNSTVKVGGGTLDLGTFDETIGIFGLESGSLAGSGTLTATRYDLHGGTVIANLGAGQLIQSGGNTALSGTSSALQVEVTGGTLALGGSERLAAASTLRVGAGTLDLGAFNQSVATFELASGSVGGTGTLVASVYHLNGGQIDANLGAGTLVQMSNTTRLNGTSDSGMVNVNGGTLALGASDRLNDAASIVVSNGGSLDLGTSSDTVRTFILTGGSLTGIGVLSSDSYELNGGRIDANLGVGILSHNLGTTTLNGTSASTSVKVTGGTLGLGASDRLVDDAAVVVSGTGILDLRTFNETIGTFNLDGGSLDGRGTLTAARYALQGGIVNANLGTGLLEQISSNTTLSGTSAAALVHVNGGRLTLGGTNRLAAASTVTVNGGASLDLGGFNQLIGTYVQNNNGSLGGSGTLTAGSYQLNGGTITANLGNGTLTQISNLTTLGGRSAASIIKINSGTLALGSSERLADNATVTIGAAALDIGAFSDRVRSLSLNQGILDGTGTLTADTYQFNGGVVNANLGTGSLLQLSGSTTLKGTSAAAQVTVESGALILGVADRLDDGARVLVRGNGILTLASEGDLVKSYTQSGSGTLAGDGELSVKRRALLKGGTIAGNLSGNTVVNGNVKVTGSVGGGYLKLTGGNLRLSGTAEANAKIGKKGTLTGVGVVDGNVRNGGTLTAGSYVKTLDITGSLVNKGSITLKVKSAAKFQSIKAGSMKFGGSLVVVNKGAGLDRGDVVRLFRAGSFSNEFDSFTAIGFGKNVRFNPNSGKLFGLGGVNRNPNGGSQDPSFHNIPAAGSSAESPLSAGAESKSSLQAASASAAVASFSSGMAEEDMMQMKSSALPVPLIPGAFNQAAANSLSPEVHRGMADYTGQALRSHTWEAMNSSPVSRVGKTQVFAVAHTNSAGVENTVSHAGYDTEVNAVTAGARYDMGENAMIAGFIGLDEGDIKGHMIDTDATGLVIGGFGNYVLEKDCQTTITAGVSYGSYDYDSARDSVGGLAKAEGTGSDAVEFTLGVSSVAYKNRGFQLIPSAIFRYTTGSVDHFDEGGSGVNLAVKSQDINSSLLDLGVDMEYAFDSKVSLIGRVGYVFDFSDSDHSVSATFLNGASTGQQFSVNAPGMDNEAVTLDAGAFYDINDHTRLGLTYRGEFRIDSEYSQSFGLGLSYGF